MLFSLIYSRYEVELVELLEVLRSCCDLLLFSEYGFVFVTLFRSQLQLDLREREALLHLGPK